MKRDHIHQDHGDYSLRTILFVPATPRQAYKAFTEGMADWWVKEYTWSGPDTLVDIGIEPRKDGMAYEIGPHGFRVDWGRVLIWEPPRRLVFTWQIGPDRTPVPDPAKASEIDARFEPEADGTRVEVEHRHFDRHGEAAEGYLRALSAGWRELLARYADVLRNHA